jgi:(p)ppGpp synthase/HD superfamily hydrolase
MSVDLDAMQFAQLAHQRVGQLRKYTLEPYIVHPAEVVSIVKSVAHTDEMLAAAWLHDTVEDTDVEINDILEHFGQQVADLVAQLTDVSRPSDGNRAVRKAIDCHHLSRASGAAQTIKVADIISNTASISQHDAKFAVVYIAEIKRVLDVCVYADPGLLLRARHQLDCYTGVTSVLIVDKV